MRKVYIIIGVILILCSGTHNGFSQADTFTKYFKYYKNIATNIDIFADGPNALEPFDKPVKEARQRLVLFLGPDLAKGALVVCSTLEQKDAVDETRMLKQGFQWILTVMTPESASQQMIAQMKARAGGDLPPERLQRLQNPTPEMKKAAEARLVGSTVLRMAYAVISTTLAPARQYRSSRLEDMGRSPLADWLDIGLASYAAGDASLNRRFLQEHLDEGFPLEDVLTMSRPFVAPTEGGSTAMRGGQFVQRTAGDGGPAANGSGGRGMAPGEGNSPAGTRIEGPPMEGGRSGGGFNLPKDVQDRMIFDCQAASFFKYAVEKMGVDKTREVVQWNREGKLTRDALFREGYLGTNLDQVESDWLEWVKKLKAESTHGGQMTTGNAQKPAEPRQ